MLIEKCLKYLQKETYFSDKYNRAFCYSNRINVDNLSLIIDYL